jgi:proteasome lid subunit RPN8/RPN11
MAEDPADSAVVVRLAPDLIRSVIVYLRRANQDERGGVLLGNRSGPDIWVTGAVFPPQLAQAYDHCAFDATCVDVIRAALSGLPDDEQYRTTGSIVGWVHSHPHHGLFLSDADVGTLTSWRQLDHQAVAIVVDPFLQDEPRRRIAWWGAVTGHGTYVATDDGRTDVLSVSRASGVAAAIGDRAPAGGGWDVVTEHSIITVFPSDSDPMPRGRR